jgi:hypothetical protein
VHINISNTSINHHIVLHRLYTDSNKHSNMVSNNSFPMDNTLQHQVFHSLAHHIDLMTFGPQRRRETRSSLDIHHHLDIVGQHNLKVHIL